MVGVPGAGNNADAIGPNLGLVPDGMAVDDDGAEIGARFGEFVPDPGNISFALVFQHHAGFESGMGEDVIAFQVK